MVSLNDEIKYLKGIGPKRAKTLNKKGFFLVGDFLSYLPFRYEDREFIYSISDILPGKFYLLKGKIIASRVSRTRKRGISFLEIVVSDSTGILNVYFFNMAFLKDRLKEGEVLYLYGKVERDFSSKNILSMKNPEFEVESGDELSIHKNRIIPVYRKIGSLSSKRIREIIFNLLNEKYSEIEEILPHQIIEKYSFPLRRDAIKEVHFPSYRENYPFSREEFIKLLNSFSTRYHKRLIYEEFFLFQFGLKLISRGYKKKSKNRKIVVDLNLKKEIGKILPFNLTESQKIVMREIARDLSSPYPMNRLLQGDVGSGKTIIALISIIIVVKNGYQAVLMAPTEILAEQHYFNFKKLLQGRNFNVVILKSGLKAGEKEEIKKLIKSGEASIVVGTHSVIEGDVEFKNLGLVIIDEQHRFGVMQRVKLYEKGENPDVLVMTATPIPRTLALTLYGDLDISVIDGFPPGRKGVDTFLYFPDGISQLYDEIHRELDTGNRGYVIFPLIDESEKLSLKSAIKGFEEISSVFKGYRVGLLHGKMKSEEKQRVMDLFSKGEIHILVSTTVVEVGIDVKDANFIVIEHAERFGLSQLHQLRGRVGRGERKGKCFLVVYSNGGENTLKRLQIFASTNDGFKIAEEDMKLRGPGDLGGLKQWGYGGFRFGNILRDRKILCQASEDVENFLKSGKIDEKILSKVKKLFGEKFKFINWG